MACCERLGVERWSAIPAPTSGQSPWARGAELVLSTGDLPEELTCTP